MGFYCMVAGHRMFVSISHHRYHPVRDLDFHVLGVGHFEEHFNVPQNY